MENRQSFFILTLNLKNIQNNSFYLENLKNQVDLILSSMKADNIVYKFKQIKNKQIIYFFRTNLRKRNGQLVKFCDQYFEDEQDYNSRAITKNIFESEILNLRKNGNFREIVQLEMSTTYTGRDIAKFEIRKNWFPWQEKLFNMIFESHNESVEELPIIIPSDRTIVSIYCPIGKSGKSQFLKWISIKRKNDIGRIGYGTASQLKSSIANIGARPIWFIDLARSKTKDQSQTDLLSTVEDLKSGCLTISMYGKGDIMFFDPPHIFITSNYLLNYEGLSGDRWEVYKINNKKDLEPIKDPKKYMNSKQYKKEQKRFNITPAKERVK